MRWPSGWTLEGFRVATGNCPRSGSSQRERCSATSCSPGSCVLAGAYKVARPGGSRHWCCCDAEAERQRRCVTGGVIGTIEICTTSTFRKKLAVGDLAVVAAAPSCDQSLDLRQGSVSICVLSAALLVSLAHPLLEAASPVLVPPLNIGHAPRGHAPDTAPPASTPRAAAAEDFCSTRQGWRSLGAPAGPRASTSTAVP